MSLRYCQSNLSNDPTQSHFPVDSGESQVDGCVEIEIYALGGGERQGTGRGSDGFASASNSSCVLHPSTQSNLQPYQSIPHIPPLLPCRSESARFHLLRLQLIATIADFWFARCIELNQHVRDVIVMGLSRWKHQGVCGDAGRGSNEGRWIPAQCVWFFIESSWRPGLLWGIKDMEVVFEEWGAWPDPDVDKLRNSQGMRGIRLVKWKRQKLWKREEGNVDEKQWRMRRGSDVRVHPMPLTHPTSPPAPTASHPGYCPSPRSQLACPI